MKTGCASSGYSVFRRSRSRIPPGAGVIFVAGEYLQAPGNIYDGTMPDRRSVLHVDMNNFFASVELLERPDLADRAVIVGGDIARRRGVVLAKNDIAKRSSVQTGEALVDALRKCPSAVVLPPQRERYQEYSERAMAIYRRYSQRLRSMGLDECWIGLEDRSLKEATRIAHEIRCTVRAELRLTVSVGVSFTLTFAKLGSDYKKPDAVTVISPQNYRGLIWPLPVERMLFVGPVLAERLHRLAIHTIGDLARTDPETLFQLFGRHGSDLSRAARGEDGDRVELESEQEPARSIGAMRTTPVDLLGLDEAAPLLRELAEEVAGRLAEQEQAAGTVKLIYRSSSFETTTRQRSLPLPIYSAGDIYRAAMELFSEQSELGDLPLRLLGITMSRLEPRGVGAQLSFADLMNASAAERAAESQPDSRAVDRLIAGFTPGLLRRGRDLLTAGEIVYDERDKRGVGASPAESGPDGGPDP